MNTAESRTIARELDDAMAARSVAGLRTALDKVRSYQRAHERDFDLGDLASCASTLLDCLVEPDDEEPPMKEARNPRPAETANV